jgi:phosphatidylserine/phosphatidylglycerophosphate/cardiolipin synthase-like enzyme
MNADNRSMSFNDESNLVIFDDGVTTRLEKLFSDDLKYSEEIDLAEFRKRGMRERLYEHACHLVWRVL